MTVDGVALAPLSHHAGNEPGLAARRLDVLLQVAMRLAAGVARPGVGPGPAFVVGGAGGLAGVLALSNLEVKILVIPAGTVARGFDRRVQGVLQASSPSEPLRSKFL